jgi:hypothetical protein
MTRPAYLPQMPVSVWSPFMGREVWLSRREGELVARVQAGWKGNQRLLAALTGYTLGGLSSVLRTPRKLGVLGISTQRGRLGFTRLKLQAGVRRLNVLHVDGVRKRLIDSVSTSEDISIEEGQHRPAGTTKWLKIDQPGMARAF